MRRSKRADHYKMVQKPTGARQSLVKYGGSPLEGTWISILRDEGEAATADVVPSIQESRLSTLGPNQENSYRTIIISGPLTDTTLSSVLGRIRGDAILSAHLLDTRKLTGFDTELVSLCASLVLSGLKSTHKSILTYSTVSREAQTLCLPRLLSTAHINAAGA